MSVRLLESRVIDQIAAGEVVERPASVVKELLENALDAGATHVEVVLRDGGREGIRIVDDGFGMNRQDAMLAIERHATSKIRTVEDLTGVATLGFRGEALPSIAAVSKFTLTTRPRDETTGTRVQLNAGTLLDVREVGTPVGTVIDVRALFHTLPARRAFLRAPGTELGHCREVVLRQALLRTDVGFVIQHDGRELLRVAAGDDPRHRICTLLGLDPETVVPVDATDGVLTLRGFAAHPTVHRAAIGTALFLFVGGRWVRDGLLRRAVDAAYRDRLPPGRHPVVVLDLQVPAGSVDVNVHPTKAEVRFVDPAGISAFVTLSLSDQLGEAPRLYSAALPLRASAPMVVTEPALRPSLSALPPDLPTTAAVVSQPLPAQPGPVNQGQTPVAVLLGVARGRYLVLDTPDGVVVVDGGRLARHVGLRHAGMAPCRLLAPVRVALSSGERSAVLDSLERLSAYGLVVSDFSGSEVVVRAVPQALLDVAPQLALRAVLPALAGGEDLVPVWVATLPPAPIPDDLVQAAVALGLPLAPVVGTCLLPS